MQQIDIYEKQNQLDRQLSAGLLSADNLINRNYLIDAVNHGVMPMEEDPNWARHLRLFKISKIVYDKKENVNDKLISVFTSLQNIQGSVLLIADGKPEGVSLYLGIRESANSVTDIRTSRDVLFGSFLGNFPGSELQLQNTSAAKRIMEEIISPDEEFRPKTVSSVTVIPSMRDKEKDKFVQGLEKFFDTMRSVGNDYTAILLASAVSKSSLEERKRSLEDMFSALSPLSKTSLAYGENMSSSVTEGTSDTFSTSVNENISTTNGTNVGYNESENWGTSSGNSFSMGGVGSNSGVSHGRSRGYSSGQSWSRSVSKGTSESKSVGTSTSTAQSDGSSLNMTIEHQNKSVMNLMEKIDAQLKRIKSCEAFGIWEFSAYFLSGDVATSVVAANTYRALMSGDESDVENSFVNTWSGTRDRASTQKILQYLKCGAHPLLEVSGDNMYQEQIVMPSTMVSSKELPLLMGIPHKSIAGVPVSTIAEFGRNVVLQSSFSPEKTIDLGWVYHMGVTEENAPVRLDLNSFTSHCFVTGSTGSGKSNTTYCLLYEFIRHNIPFLVIEPAKGEYKDEFCNLPGIHIFSTNPRIGEMLKLNPFRFHYPQIHILEHLDRLIEIFNACWEMYAAMPAILKDAVERIYVDKGWDLLNSEYIGEGDPVYPTFQDLMSTLPVIINNSSYSSDTKGDYVGALVTRVTSLTNGISGQIFCDSYDVEDETLFDENTIVDLSRVGSSETKSLIMGILVLKLSEYRMATRRGANHGLRHITVMEEAHNLLKNAKPGEGSNVVAKSVEMICNNIAEMRTYGEGFVIVDQSPSAVDIAAIKNTNTKIVMRIPEKNDREAVGNAISLNEDQIRELSRLSPGKAAVMQNNWLDAVLTSIHKAPAKYRGEVGEASTEELQEIRGFAVEQIIDRYFDDTPVEEMLGKVEALSASDYKKREIRRCLENVFSTMSGTENSDERYNFYLKSLLNISGVRNLFSTLDRQVQEAKETDGETDYSESALNTWNESFRMRLQNYILMQKYNAQSLSRLFLQAYAAEQEEYKMVAEKLGVTIY